MPTNSDDRLARAGAAIAGSLRFLARLPVPVLGPLDDPARLPDDFVIDYVRVWQRKDLASEADGPRGAALARP